MGVDAIAPRGIALLGDPGLLALLAIWTAMMNLGAVPSQVALLVVVLIPKPTGGVRPIGLFPTFTRVLTRWLRRTYGSSWLAKHPRDFWYGEAGKSVEQCIWAQAAAAEYAVARAWSPALCCWT